MLQCSVCNRFVIDNTKNCIYCNSDKFENFYSKFKLQHSKDIGKYETEIDELSIKGKKYKILGVIEKGGVSTILKIGDKKSNNYALKVPIAFDEEFSNMKGNSEENIKYSVKCLNDEIDNLKNFRKDTVIKIYYSGKSTIKHKKKEVTIPVIMMEMAETTLAHILYNSSEGTNKITHGEKEKIVKDILNFLKNMHKEGMTHRDLSPDNIFVVNRDSEIRYIIADFGTTKQHADIMSSIFSEYTLAHKPYADPVRHEGSIIYKKDQRIDIYSVGIIIADIFIDNFWFNIVEKKDRFYLKDYEENFEKDVLTKELKKYYDKDIYKIIKKASKRDINKRYRNINQLIKEVEKYFKKCPGELLRSKDTSRLNLYINYEIKLPFSLKPQSTETSEIKYTGNNNITFEDFKDYEIVFNRRIIYDVQIKDSTIYKASRDRNKIKLSIDRDAIKKYKSKYSEIFSKCIAKLIFSFILKIDYIKL